LIAKILRGYSYLFHLVLCLFLLAMTIVAMSSTATFSLEILPWKGDELTQWLLWGSIAGLISIVLAVTGIFRFLFPVWALVVLVMMIRGYLLQPYSFGGTDPFYKALGFIGAALLAFLASLTLFRSTRRRR
jgi:hypothetical protein